MIRKLLSFAVALALFGTLSAGAASAQVTSKQVVSKWWGGVDSWERGDFEGRWMANDRMGPMNHRAHRAAQLPSFLRIDQGRRQVRITDFRNNLIQVIALQNLHRATREDATVLRGEFRGARLVAEGVDSHGREMKQVLVLRDKGRTLVVRTQIERGRSGQMMEFEQTYHRA